MRPTAATPVENPYCSGKLTRVRGHSLRRIPTGEQAWVAAEASLAAAAIDRVADDSP